MRHCQKLKPSCACVAAHLLPMLPCRTLYSADWLFIPRRKILSPREYCPLPLGIARDAWPFCPAITEDMMPDDIHNADRRGFLKCMTWAGTAMVWSVAGGIPRSALIGTAEAAPTGFTFAQVS